MGGLLPRSFCLLGEMIVISGAVANAEQPAALTPAGSLLQGRMIDKTRY